MKKVLIIGGGVEQIEAIKIAKEMGCFVIVTDMNPKAPGIKYANKSYIKSTTNIPGNIEVAEKEKIDGVMTVCSETAVMTVASVAEKLKLPSFSKKTAIKATNKLEMRNALKKENVLVSSYAVADCLQQAEIFINNNEGPWVLKPVDSSGQRGTYILRNKKQLENYFIKSLEYSKAGAVLIDRYLKGPEVHVAMQVINGNVHFLAISDRITLNEKHFGIAIRHVGPSSFSKEIMDAIKRVCIKSIKAIELFNGVATCEIIIEKNEPVLLEVAVRTPGGYLREVAMYLSGIDVTKTTIWNCLGEEKKIDEMKTERIYPAISVKFITMLNLDTSIEKIKTIEHIDQITKLDNIKTCNFHFETPFDVPELNSSVGRFGVIIASGLNKNQAISDTEKAFNMLKINGLHLKEYNSYNIFNEDFK
jgi:biotin carboxylase